MQHHAIVSCFPSGSLWYAQLEIINLKCDADLKNTFFLGGFAHILLTFLPETTFLVDVLDLLLNVTLHSDLDGNV